MAYDLQKLDAMMQAFIAEKKLPGVSVAVRGPEGVIFEKGYGIAGLEGRKVDEHTMYGIASMSKSMTTLACCILAAEGKLSFDDPVCKYFPNFRVPGNPQQDVTLRHLAMHTAGIPPMEPLEWSIALNTPGRDSDWVREMKNTAPNKMETIDEIIDYIATNPYKTLGQAGEIMSYSNEGYAILSYVVDIASGTTLEEFLMERVFKPIGMTRSILDIDASEATAMSGGNITSLFEVGDDGELVCDNQWSILPPFRGCACVKSTAHDMARYYQCIANRGVIDGVQAIPAEAIEIFVGAGFPLQEKAFYCYGLNKREKAGHVICEHSGGLHGVSSHGGLLLDENYGFAALCNQGDSDPEPLVWMMYNMIMGLPLEESHRWLHPTGEDFKDPEMLVGKYICHEGIPVVVEVFLKDGKAWARTDETEIELLWSDGTWFMTRRLNTGALGRMHFFIREGKAWAVQVYSRVYQRLDD